MDKKKKFIVNVLYYCIFAAFLYGGIKYVLPIFMPFLIAILIAALLQLPAGWISRKIRIPKSFISFILVAAFYILLFFLVFGLGNKVLSLAGSMIIRLPSIYQKDVLPFINEAIRKLDSSVFSNLDSEMAQSLETELTKLTQNLGQTISEFSLQAVKALSGYVAGIPGAVVKIIITVIATFFMAADYDKIIGLVFRLLPDKGRATVEMIRLKIVQFMVVYLKSYSFLFALTFVELTVGFLILKVPYAVGLGILIAIFDILPILGTGGALLPWAFVMGITGNYKMAIGLVLLYVVITVIRNSIEPRIVGKQIGLHPLATLMSMFVGINLLGLIGMVIFPVSLSILVNLEKEGVIHFPPNDQKNF